MSVTTFKRILATVLTVAVLALGFMVFRPKNSGHHYSALVADASELVRNNSVRVRDVQVGKVTSIAVDGFHATVGFTVAKAVRLPAQTTAVLRQTSMRGEMFVDLEPQ